MVAGTHFGIVARDSICAKGGRPLILHDSARTVLGRNPLISLRSKTPCRGSWATVWGAHTPHKKRAFPPDTAAALLSEADLGEVDALAGENVSETYCGPLLAL